MPFTFAHPAAVLPLRGFLWFPGLVVGSVAPDVAYYLPVPGGPGSTHSVTGLFGIDLLLGVLLLLIGVLVLAPLLALSSEGWRARVTPPDLVARLRTWRARIIAVGSLIVGAATHLAWDAVTHTDGAAVRHWPVLRLSVVGPHRLYNVIGYVSSLGGLLLLGIVVLRWYRRAPHGNGEHWRALSRGIRSWVLGGIAVAAAAGSGIALADPVSQVSAYDWVRRLLVGGVQGTGLALALYVLCWHLARQFGMPRERM
ncbi:hypothetical protein ALI22I_07020 [Saccharothrix sp. ALI-22-I]|uniref:DUF4184 family protein n=1 Tax=Saccharothrix sp. ALI-22-I TaxID=1933778 RepID=UPI00097BE039|nr:DUF4184 family protein [Saccharothrix sp. ALI-22-I]ONI91823.1 hypothetical protein ALI22I_07020 [Saccharothrix sp. ALI-22-I]